MRWWVGFALWMATSAALAASPAPANPALSPVTFHDTPQHVPVTLVRGGTAQFVIASDMDAEQGIPTGWRSIEPAVQALQEAFKRVTGQDVRCVDAESVNLADPATPVILIGRSVLTDRLGLDAAKLPREGFSVRTFAWGVAIVGQDGSTNPGSYRPGDERIQHFRLCGTLWGAQDFCERFLGLRYYYPGLGVVAPPCRDLTLPPVYYTDQPAYAERSQWNFFMEFGRQSETWPWDRVQTPPDWSSFANRWRIANSSRFVLAHTPNHWAEVHAADQPELFYRDPEGKLWLDPKSFAGNVYDVSCRATAEQYIADCARFYETGWIEPWKNWHCPNSEYVPFGLPDNYVVVENGRTRDLLNPAAGRFGVMSDVMAQFHIWLAESAARKLPGKTVTGYAYAHHRLPPQRAWKFPPNFELQQCHFSQLGLFTHPQVLEYEVGITRRWAELLGKKVRTYIYLSGEAQEYPMLGETAALPEYFRRFGPHLAGVCFDGGGSWARSHLALYCAYRLAWNPRFDVTAALAEYHRVMYGAAVEPMARLTRTMTERWQQYQIKLDPQSPMVHIDRDQVYGRVFPREVIQDLQADLAAARAAVAPESVEARRIAFVEQGYQRFFELAATYGDLKPGTYEAPRVAEGAITVDGNLNEAAWGRTPPFEFRKPLTGGKTVFPSTGKAVWTADGLYLSFWCAEYEPDTLKAEARERDGPVYEDDSLEIFLSPGESKERYVHLAVNSRGIVYESQTALQPTRGKTDVAWNWQGLEASTVVGDKAWQVELRLPVAALGLDTPPTHWRANFIRNKLTVPHETQSFSPTMGNNHDERHWGWLRLTGAVN